MADLHTHCGRFAAVPYSRPVAILHGLHRRQHGYLHSDRVQFFSPVARCPTRTNGDAIPRGPTTKHMVGDELLRDYQEFNEVCPSLNHCRRLVSTSVGVTTPPNAWMRDGLRELLSMLGVDRRRTNFQSPGDDRHTRVIRCGAQLRLLRESFAHDPT